MNKKEYSEITDLENKSVCEKAKYIAFYLYKSSGQKIFSMRNIADAFTDFGQNRPNESRLKKELLRTSFFTNDDVGLSAIRFTEIGLETLEEEQQDSWNDFSTILSDSELLDENKFCGKRGYIDSLIQQINHSYANNCFDAAAVLMRRLFEVLLVLSYQAHGIDDEIKTHDDRGYIMLERIVANAKKNPILKLSRVKSHFDNIRNLGNYSAHSITYLSSKKDIDDIRIHYRAALEELFYKANLF